MNGVVYWPIVSDYRRKHKSSYGVDRSTKSAYTGRQMKQNIVSSLFFNNLGSSFQVVGLAAAMLRAGFDLDKPLALLTMPEGYGLNMTRLDESYPMGCVYLVGRL